MAPTSSVRLERPQSISPNPENPRLIFRQRDLDALQESIRNQGILVPLTVYEDGNGLVLLDGERRWRCALKLGLMHVPVIVQAKPDRMQNIMMMFAIHNARRDWDPLPTAYKLRDLENEFTRRQGRAPTEAELAELASLSRGVVRRLKKLLGLPEEYQDLLLSELEKPRSEQKITVDHVLEATKGAEALEKRGIISRSEEEAVRAAIIDKFQRGIVKNTVDPRKLARVARAVARDEVSEKNARRVVLRLVSSPNYSIDDAFQESVARADFEHATEQLASRVAARLDEIDSAEPVGEGLREALLRLERSIARLLGG